MNKTVLFSPVGGTDPISISNMRDGSMLHICRMYKPDKVYLYMSKEILDYHREDNRYVYCIDRLSELQNHKIEYEIIERPELVDVQEFDYYYEDFRKIIGEICRSLDSTDRLLLNVSSGTPSMKSSLIVLKTLGEFECIPIQVSTPMRKMQEHTHKGYDNETLWELNEDNSDNCENRCSEVICPNLLNIKNEEMLKKLIRVYDYEGALEVIKGMPEKNTEKYIEAVKMASSRLMLDFRNVDKSSKLCGIDCTPIKDSNKRKYFEYALNLYIALKKKEYANYVRSITPLIVDMFAMIIKRIMGIDIYDFCDFRNETYRWSQQKLNNSETGQRFLEIWNNRFSEGFSYGIIRSDHLREIVISDCTDSSVRTHVDDLRNIEQNIRNLAAHDIISVTEERILELTGFSSETIMNKIKKLFSYTDLNVKKEYWDSYDIMNENIIRLIDSSH